MTARAALLAAIKGAEGSVNRARTYDYPLSPDDHQRKVIDLLCAIIELQCARARLAMMEEDDAPRA